MYIRLGTHAESGYRRNKLSPRREMLYQALPTDEYRRGLIRFFRFFPQPWRGPPRTGSRRTASTNSIAGSAQIYCVPIRPANTEAREETRHEPLSLRLGSYLFFTLSVVRVSFR